MKIGIVSPFPGTDVETGSIFMLGSYLKSLGNTVFFLANDFVMPTAERSNGRSSLNQSTAFLQEQSKFCQWSGMKSLFSSAFLRPVEYQASERIVDRLTDSELFSFSIPGIEVYQEIRTSVRDYFGTDTPALTPHNSKIIRELLKRAIQMYLSGGRFAAEIKPDLMLVGGSGFITSTLLRAFEQTQLRSLEFRWILSERCIRIAERPGTMVHDWFYVLDDLGKLRSDVQNWPGELLRLVREVLDTFEIGVEIPVRAAV